jgi:hypothetical protein
VEIDNGAGAEAHYLFKARIFLPTTRNEKNLVDFWTKMSGNSQLEEKADQIKFIQVRLWCVK